MTVSGTDGSPRTTPAAPDLPVGPLDARHVEDGRRLLCRGLKGIGYSLRQTAQVTGLGLATVRRLLAECPAPPADGPGPPPPPIAGGSGAADAGDLTEIDLAEMLLEYEHGNPDMTDAHRAEALGWIKGRCRPA